MDKETDLSKNVFTRQTLSVTIFFQAFSFAAENTDESINHPDFNLYILGELKKIKDKRDLFNSDFNEFSDFTGISYQNLLIYKDSCECFSSYRALEHVFNLYLDKQKELRNL